MNTIESITNFIFIPETKREDLPNIDAMIVLGNDHVETMADVFEVWKSGKIKKIILSGHSKNSDKKPEALRFFERGLELGIPREEMILEPNSTNTKENFENVAKIFSENKDFSNLQNAMIVCPNFHARRSLMTAKNFLPENINYYFLPTIDERNIRPEDWWSSKISTNRILEEIGRISQYSIKGDLSLK